MSELHQTIVTAQVEEVKSPIAVFDLPSGWLAEDGTVYREVEVREIQGHEEDILGAKSISGQKKLSSVITACTVRVGAFTDRDMIRKIVAELPVGDRIALLFFIRRVTLGDIFPFEEKCPECEATHLYQVNFEDLEITPMPTPEKRIYDVTLPSGKTARFKIMTGEDEENLSKTKKGDLDSISLQLLARVLMINDKPATLKDIKSLGMRDRNFLRDQFNEVEGGIETSVEVSCLSCEHEFTHELSIDRSFFSPSALQKASKRKSSS